MSRSPTLAVGYVARPHGTSGEVAVRTFDPASRALEAVERVLLRHRDGAERELPIASARPAARDVLLALRSIEDRDAAAALQGATVLVFRADLPPPAEGEYFQGDLVGLRAVSPAGELLGQVEEVWNTGPVPNLVIRGAGGELLVPFADDFVGAVDLDAGLVVVRPPDVVESP
ncbi:MAG TPA: ribosome maturation factor RimM [Myxococcaceae bacterium]|nr:ribosome maturation factor RimM [Myxococcaceae bacterium]